MRVIPATDTTPTPYYPADHERWKADEFGRTISEIEALTRRIEASTAETAELLKQAEILKTRLLSLR